MFQPPFLKSPMTSNLRCLPTVSLDEVMGAHVPKTHLTLEYFLEDSMS